ncbi:MAG: glycerol-3-phosphate dehydrogenase [Firmicutes bacterium]|nr:glycerol-3-phosphate dehydrogenase [Bacillota bacterium]
MPVDTTHQVTIIGAGVMGSALTVPLSDNGRRVNLWGTELDGEIIDSIRAGGVHPVLKAPIPGGVRTFKVCELAEAVSGSDVILMAISSYALGKVFARVVPFIRPGMTVITVSKGLEPRGDGKIVILPEILESLLPTGFREAVPIVAVGGPSKAAEVARRSLTPVVYASKRPESAEFCAGLIRNRWYLVQVSDDLAGVELCAALKNVYAIGLGLCEGFDHGRGTPHKNAKGGLMTYAVLEMARIVEAMGGDARTAFGLAGAGDLELTGEAGRNRVLGEQIGWGVDVVVAVEQMKSEGLTVEGYPAARNAHTLLAQLESDGRLSPHEAPVLDTLYRVLYEGLEPYRAVRGLLERVMAG